VRSFIFTRYHDEVDISLSGFRQLISGCGRRDKTQCFIAYIVCRQSKVNKFSCM
jgi:hypothetical protein